MPAPLPARPAVTTAPARATRQPYLGFAGLLLVIPVAVLVAIGAGGAEPSLRILGPLVTFALPAVAMVAFWWEDWPGSSLRPGWSGLVDTLFVAAMAVALTVLGRLVVDRWDPGGVFAGAAFPATVPLAGGAFVVMLQLTLVCEGWPLRRLDRITGGLLALLVSWAVALVLYAAGLHRWPGFGAVLVLIGAWQVLVFLVWRGWPVATVASRGTRIAAGNMLVVAGAAATYAGTAALDVEPGVVSAAAGAFVAAGLVVAMLFEGWIRSRAGSLATVIGLAAGLYVALTAYADRLTWTVTRPAEWVAHATLNAIGVAVILHVAIGRRWPFAAPDEEVGHG